MAFIFHVIPSELHGSKEDYFLKADDEAVCAELARRQQIQLKRANDSSGKRKGKDRDADDDAVDSDMEHNDGEHDMDRVTKWQAQHMQLAESRFLADLCSFHTQTQLNN